MTNKDNLKQRLVEQRALFIEAIVYLNSGNILKHNEKLLEIDEAIESIKDGE